MPFHRRAGLESNGRRQAESDYAIVRSTPSEFFAALQQPDVQQAITFGTAIAYLLVRWRFPGRTLLDTLKLAWRLAVFASIEGRTRFCTRWLRTLVRRRRARGWSVRPR
ncbi:MAG: hypothetical protein ABSB70_12240 [Candidatus Velthaea sp.]|jgi:hypothetical protein